MSSSGHSLHLVFCWIIDNVPLDMKAFWTQWGPHSGLFILPYSTVESGITGFFSGVDLWLPLCFITIVVLPMSGHQINQADKMVESSHHGSLKIIEERDIPDMLSLRCRAETPTSLLGMALGTVLWTLAWLQWFFFLEASWSMDSVLCHQQSFALTGVTHFC